MFTFQKFVRFGAKCPGAKCPWGILSWGILSFGAKCLLAEDCSLSKQANRHIFKIEFSVCQYCNGAHTDKMADRTLGATSREIDKQIEQNSFCCFFLLQIFCNIVPRRRTEWHHQDPGMLPYSLHFAPRTRLIWIMILVIIIIIVTLG